MADEKSYTAVVEKIVPRGRHGPYAVARAESLDGSVTFSLDYPVWLEKDWPETGNCVVLCDIREKRAGWRAQNGRFVRPSDKQQTAEKKEEKRA